MGRCVGLASLLSVSWLPESNTLIQEILAKFQASRVYYLPLTVKERTIERRSSIRRDFSGIEEGKRRVSRQRILDTEAQSEQSPVHCMPVLVRPYLKRTVLPLSKKHDSLVAKPSARRGPVSYIAYQINFSWMTLFDKMTSMDFDQAFQFLRAERKTLSSLIILKRL